MQSNQIKTIVWFNYTGAEVLCVATQELNN